MSARFSAVLLAAGRGTRLHTQVPKAYIELCGKPLLCYSLERFSECDQIAQIVVVLHRDDRERCERCVEETSKRVELVYGGEHRQDSALAGVRAAHEEYVLVHDAARPLVSPELIERVLEATLRHGAAVPALPVTDSLKRVREGQIVENVDRIELVRVQTPQGFRRELILRALQRACAERRYFTDESGAVLALLGVQAKIVPGDEFNLKITTSADLELARRWLSRGERRRPRC
ncbi:MAG: 2-C-methyl-D-erythritol 4-phosphate cytidylyltransferase [Candidatus Bipolaricaulota bacterium]|nr:2-C-methyl-D-erythritol 4-phosphate cytidylyltransferase [Candidatus Bipolaricaulota bacterium]MDW8111006.1 2-C-methyl-D-erythritol 4-phosphate cytidylyltransferase [Candidatus Bipolaricaulota bacterium]MDW8329834.1 2-C-methyl-D-erythritol 4-phosphate cytidylyltransferase [Candidatus Bipolaricaulota bacterium]